MSKNTLPYNRKPNPLKPVPPARPQPIVYLDFHGVLADFHQACADRFRFHLSCGDTHYADQMGMPREAFWTVLNEVQFWATLPVLPQGVSLMQDLVNICDRNRARLCLLTRPHWLVPRAYEGTLRLAMSLGFRFDQIIFAYEKSHCAPGFLIDDEQNNLRAWVAQGGNGFLWPAPHNNFCSPWQERNTASNQLSKLFRARHEVGIAVQEFLNLSNR